MLIFAIKFVKGMVGTEHERTFDVILIGFAIDPLVAPTLMDPDKLEIIILPFPRRAPLFCWNIPLTETKSMKVTPLPEFEMVVPRPMSTCFENTGDPVTISDIEVPRRVI
jgi:hypothetical protein